ncbi:MAG: 50S ribosomal protein L32 [Niabella sp.]|nr:MAG: 50S ribosomal protein L32 [Niabella sp.]
MAQPKHRTSKAKSAQRRSHQNKKIAKIQLVKCKSCGKLKKPHTVCKNCSSY